MDIVDIQLQQKKDTAQQEMNQQSSSSHCEDSTRMFIA